MLHATNKGRQQPEHSRKLVICLLESILAIVAHEKFEDCYLVSAAEEAGGGSIVVDFLFIVPPNVCWDSVWSLFCYSILCVCLVLQSS